MLDLLLGAFEGGGVPVGGLGILLLTGWLSWMGGAVLGAVGNP